MNQKWENMIYKRYEVDDRIPILKLIRSRSKKQKETKIWIEKDGFKPGARLDGKIVETFLGGCKLKCDQLVDMHHTLN